ncbi:unnamed protein product [Rotaria sp. Silwood1]|nr:unnamed protein product [Rotaria sp. Silwood1]CAF1680063.1 unnamed protein product [Rotaria sp. Silwood1]CAF3797326.1 unnamed protein product [Rotaria sp. Silwood1]CAF3823414.1 unnamed protein product [Rotaria sp. Silwood1]CAF4810571.1 unnamed protein product [Rotaria sp. Silwood1]
MELRDKTTQTVEESRKCFGLTIGKLFNFILSLFLPLMLGIFTVVVTLNQQSTAAKQRSEDRQLAREQRLEDRNETDLQRAQELYVLTIQQETQMKAISEQYKDEVLSTYIKEIGELLEKSNGLLTSNSLINTLSRVKTLNAIRQLDGTRNIHLIRFLYEAKQFTYSEEQPALDISTAKLIDINFRDLGSSQSLENSN